MDEGAKDLIRKAFEMARETRKADWHRMSAAVLKNRLLVLTERQFDEGRYGASTFTEFLRTGTGFVSLDPSTHPPTVELLDRPTESASVPVGKANVPTRIRPDLWRAIIDYSSGKPYVWDVERQCARELAANESRDLILPTVSPDELSAWRGDFVSGQAALAPETAARLAAWKEQRLPSTFLPLPLRGAWNQELKARVEKRLRGWFGERGILPPLDLSTAPSPRVVDRSAALRDLILECIAVMTDRELAEVRLPPTAVQKVLERRRTRDS